MNIIIIANVILSVAYIFFIVFYLHQWVKSNKPILVTKILGREADVGDRQRVLVSEPDKYLVVNNVSKNLAEPLKIEYEISTEKNQSVKKEKKLDYLSPGEGVKMVLGFGEFSKKYDDLFEEITEGTVTKTIPKEKLKLYLNIKITAGRVFKYERKDSYFTEWSSMKGSPRFEGHPRIDTWNRRNGEYIYKLDIAELFG